MIDIGGFIFLLVLVAVFVGLIVLQIKLSKKEAVRPGLILPIVFSVIAIAVAVAYALFAFTGASVTSTSSTAGYDEEGNFVVESEVVEYYESVEQYEMHEELYPMALNAFAVFLANIVPAVIFLIIFFLFHPFKRQEAELGKMSISDMG